MCHRTRNSRSQILSACGIFDERIGEDELTETPDCEDVRPCGQMSMLQRNLSLPVDGVRLRNATLGQSQGGP